MSIQEQLNKFISSSAGKKKIQEARNTAFKSGRPFGHLKNGAPVSAAQAKRYAEDMINEVLLALPDSLVFTQSPITRSSFLEPVITCLLYTSDAADE